MTESQSSGLRVLVTLLAIAPIAAMGQAENVDLIIDRCGRIAEAEDRIACLEAAVLALSGSPPSAPLPEQPSVDEPPAPDAVAGQPGGNGEMSPVERETIAAGEEAATAPVVSTAESPPAADASAEEIGAEQVEAQTRTREEHLEALEEARGLTVEKFETVGYRQLQVHLDNGQVWRQIRGDVQNIRVSVERNPTVDITESPIGGYRLHLTGIRRIIRVRRVR